MIKLDDSIFNTSRNGRCLKDILENPRIIQLWWDARGDASSLLANYNILLHNIRDLQIFDYFLFLKGSRRIR